MFAILLLGQTNQLTKQNTEGSGASESSAGPLRGRRLFFLGEDAAPPSAVLLWAWPLDSQGAGLTRLLPEAGATGCRAALGQVAAQRKTSLRSGNLRVWAKKMKFIFFFPKKIMPQYQKKRKGGNLIFNSFKCR